MDYGTATRLIAVANIFLGVGIPTSEWHAAWRVIANEDAPNTIDDIVEIVELVQEWWKNREAELAELAADPKAVKSAK